MTVPASAVDSTPAPPSGRDPSFRSVVLVLAGLTLWLFALRLLGPSNLIDNDQERPASYVLDALRNGHGFVQYDWTGDITSKPPLYTWIVAGLSALLGGVTRLTLYLPCALAIFGSAALVAARLRTVVGPRAALLAGVFLLANPLSAKLVALARTDALFTFTVTLTALLAHAAWTGATSATGRGWKRAWLAATLATLTKGPLGILLGFAGLAAWLPERRRGAPSPGHRSHLAGAALLLLVAGGWFLLAWQQAGDALINKMIRAELVGHAIHREGGPPGTGLILAPAYFLSRFAPWSLLAGWGLWRAVRAPEHSDPARYLQRFAAAWLLLGLLILGLASHQRGDLVAPLLPAGAILAGLTATPLVAGWSARRLLTLSLAVPMLATAGFHAQHLLHRRNVLGESRGIQLLAADFLRAGGQPDHLRHVDTPFALQFEFGTMQRALSVPEAAEALRGDSAMAAAVADFSALTNARGTAAARLRTIASWPAGADARFRIVTLGPK